MCKSVTQCGVLQSPANALRRVQGATCFAQRMKEHMYAANQMHKLENRNVYGTHLFCLGALCRQMVAELVRPLL